MEVFFNENLSLLEKNYPGITLRRLNQELEDFNNSLELFFEKLKIGIPLEYITHNKYFYNSNFYIDERVLIPRYDSESMVYEFIESANKTTKSILNICEVGVGSGCLILSALKEIKKEVNVVVSDISQDALDVFQINYEKHKKDIPSLKNLNILKRDRLIGEKEKFDLIISNPPYIPRALKNQVHAKVDQFEPDVALYLEDEKYKDWFALFFKQVYDVLYVGGKFFMEGHEDTLVELSSIAQDIFTTVELKQDLTGSNRFLKIVK